MQKGYEWTSDDPFPHSLYQKKNHSIMLLFSEMINIKNFVKGTLQILVTHFFFLSFFLFWVLS